MDQLKQIILPINTTFEAKGMVVTRNWVEIKKEHKLSIYDERTPDGKFFKKCNQIFGASYRTVSCNTPSPTNYPIIRGSSTTSINSSSLWKGLVSKFVKSDTFIYQPFEIIHFMRS